MEVEYSEEMMKALEAVYKDMPETTGCQTCRQKNGDNEMWCCRTNNPSMYSIEFAYAWDHVVRFWTDEQKRELFYRVIRNYLSFDSAKPCMFWDKGCLIHDRRPFSCRMYGVVPQKSWEINVKSLKKKFGPFYKVKPQCNLVKTKTGEKIKTEQENVWFKKIYQLEQKIISPETFALHDQHGGTYRTFHDFFLLIANDPNLLMILTEMKRSKPTPEQVEQFITTIRAQHTENKDEQVQSTLPGS